MKRIQKWFATAAIAVVAVVAVTVPAKAETTDQTAEYQEITVGMVEDITDLLNAPDCGATNSLADINAEGAYTYYYKFTTSKPGFFDLKSYANLVEHNFQSDMQIFLSTNKNFSESPVISSWMCGEAQEYKTALEAGTYYIKVSCTLHDDPDYVNNRILSLGLYMQEIERTGESLGTTMKKAISTGSSADGAMTKTSRNQWFKFNVGQKSDVTIKTVTSRPLQWDKPEFEIHVYDKDGALVHSITSIYIDESVTDVIKGLDKGTYYVTVIMEGNAVCSVKQMISVKDNYKPAPPKITSYKKNTKYVSGSGEAGTAVTVKYNGKTYKGTVKSNGKFKVTVPKLKSGSKVTVTLKDKAGNSSSKTVKVK